MFAVPSPPGKANTSLGLGNETSLASILALRMGPALRPLLQSAGYASQGMPMASAAWPARVSAPVAAP